MSKYANDQFNRYSRVEAVIYSTYRMAKMLQSDLAGLIKMKKEKIYRTPDFNNMSPYYTGKARGVDDCLFTQIQLELTEWKLYYINKKGRTIYKSTWEQLPLYIRNNGKFNGNHFWIQTPEQIKDKRDPKPFGNNPSIGTGYK